MALEVIASVGQWFDDDAGDLQHTFDWLVKPVLQDSIIKNQLLCSACMFFMWASWGVFSELSTVSRKIVLLTAGLSTDCIGE